MVGLGALGVGSQSVPARGAGAEPGDPVSTGAHLGLSWVRAGVGSRTCPRRARPLLLAHLTPLPHPTPLPRFFLCLPLHKGSENFLGIDGISLAVVCAAFIRINPARRHPAGNGSRLAYTPTPRPNAGLEVAPSAWAAASPDSEGGWTSGAPRLRSLSLPGSPQLCWCLGNPPGQVRPR
ncbi:hypothetical protein H8959_011688 [Pygathrix nigripes]